MTIRSRHRRAPRLPASLGLALAVLLSAAPAAPETPVEKRPCLWTHVGEELVRLVEAPVKGSWAGYGVAAVFGAGLVAALEHDVAGYRWVQDHRTDLLDKTMPVATLLGDGLFHLGASAALYQFGDRRDRRVAAMAVEGQINVAVVSVLLKAVFTATRPDLTVRDPSRRWFTVDPRHNGFPSGHTMTAFCAAAILGRGYDLEWLAYPLAAAAAYSRVYNQRHFPADVVAGAGIGLLIGHTVADLHAERREGRPAVRFTLLPRRDGSLGVVTWRY